MGATENRGGGKEIVFWRERVEFEALNGYIHVVLCTTICIYCIYGWSLVGLGTPVLDASSSCSIGVGIFAY